MENFNTINEAATAAQSFFSENFGYNNGVGFIKIGVNTYEFYSKNDPAMDDTFICIVASN